MKAVLDVNILASASTFPDRVPGTVLDRGMTGSFEVVISAPILERLEVVLTRPYFTERLSDDLRAQFLKDVKARARNEDPDPTVSGIAPDLEDDLVLGTAVAANADFLVTGDKGLLAIGEYRGVRIITASELLQELAQR